MAGNSRVCVLRHPHVRSARVNVGSSQACVGVVKLTNKPPFFNASFFFTGTTHTVRKYGASLWNGDIGSTLPILATSLKTLISAQLTGFGWMTIDGGGYCGGDSQSPQYRETQLRWMQLTTTLPIMRQHGQRDHTIFSWYGPADEQRLIGLVQLRTDLQAYLVAELAKLAGEGRPLNRPLNYDFPSDPKTWDLAEVGLGAQNNAAPPGRQPQGGDVLRLVPCEEAPRMTLTAAHQLVLGGSATDLCLDSHTATTMCSWERQCQVGLWPCEAGAAAHTWKRGNFTNGTADLTLRNVRDCPGGNCFVGAQGGASSGGEFCLQLKSPQPHFRPHAMTHCNAADPTQQWVATSTGKMQSAKDPNVCLASSPPPQVKGVDQYMVGDSLMAAPVLVAGARSRLVYFPSGANFTHYFTNKTYNGGSTQDVEAPLDHFPLFRVDRV